MNKHSYITNIPAAVSAGFSRARLYAALAATPLALGGTVDAIAQGSNDRPAAQAQLEEIVVTASRREEGLQNVATSITALSGGELEAQGITSFEDINRAAAGLHLEMPTNASNASIRIRGVGSAGNSGLDPSVGVLVDGVYQLRPGFAFTELMDIQRVEVLRGPQGTLFGKNTTAGVIHIHTKDPDPTEFSGKIQGVVGNYDTREVRGLVNIPLIENKLAVRLSGFNVSREGFVDNMFLDQETRGENREGARAKFLWNATDDLQVEWMSEVISTNARLSPGVVEYGVDTIMRTGQPLEELAASLGKTLPPLDMYDQAHNPDSYDDDLERHVLTVNWSLPGHNLESISAYEELETFLVDDRDQTLLDLSFLTNNAQTRAWSQEFILSSELEGPLSYVVGTFYQEEDLTSPTVIFNGEDAFELGANPAAPPVVSTTTRSNSTSAVFANVTYDLNEQWSVVGGARYTKDDKESLSTLDLGPLVITPQDGEKAFEEMTYTAKLRYYMDGGNMVYLSLDHGFKSGGFNRQSVGCFFGGSCLRPDQLTYDSETTDSIELGIKSEWLDGQLRFNGAAFYQVYEDFQVAESLPAEGFVLNTNAAEVVSTGVEFDMTAIVTDNLTVDSSVSLVRAEYDKFDSAPCATPDSPGCVNGAQDLTGERLDNAPEISANIGAEYRSSLAEARLDWFARVDAFYQSAANLDVSLAPETAQGGYSLYSARLGLEPFDRQWKATLWGKNLGDKEYAVAGGIDELGVTRIPGTPRTYGLTVDWNF